GSIQFKPGKGPAGAGIAEDLRPHLPVGVGCRVTTHRASGYAGIGAEFELAAKQVLHASLIHDQHDQINCLSADLQAKATAFNGEESWVAPSFGGTATGHSAAIASAEDE